MPRALGELFEALHESGESPHLEPGRDSWPRTPPLAEMVRDHEVCPTELVSQRPHERTDDVVYLRVRFGDLGPTTFMARRTEGVWRFSERQLTKELFEKIQLREATHIFREDSSVRISTFDGTVELDREELRPRAEALADLVAIERHGPMVLFTSRSWDRFCLEDLRRCADLPRHAFERVSYRELQVTGPWLGFRRQRHDFGGAEMRASDSAFVVFHASGSRLEYRGALRLGAYGAERVYHDPERDTIWESRLYDARTVALTEGCIEVSDVFSESRTSSRRRRRPRVSNANPGPPHPGPFDAHAEIGIYADGVNMEGSWRIDEGSFTRVPSC